jgi:rhomboid protease GluP
MQYSYGKKLKLIIPHYIISTLLAIGIPLALRWLLESVLKIELLHLETWEIWIPMCFTYVVIFITLRPKLALLKFENAHGRLFFKFIAWAGIAYSSIFINNLFNNAAHDLVKIKAVDDFESAKKSRYYLIEDFQIRGDEVGTQVDVRTAGDKNQDLKFEMFTSVPFTVHSDDKNIHPIYWLNIVHHKRISNRISKDKKEQLYNKFIEDSWTELKDYDFEGINYFEKIGKSSNRKFFLKAINNSLGSEPTGDLVLLIPKFNNFNERNGDKLYWAKLSYGIGSLIYLFALWFPQFCTESLRNYKSGNHRVDNPFLDIMQILIPNREFFVTPILLSINLLIFIIVWVSGVDALNPNAAELLKWGANRRADTTDGEWWRLVTSMFLHGGAMHLLLNMYGLIIASIYVEPLFGKWKTTLLYFVSGISGSLASIFWYEDTTSVGASGAIFGLFGAILALLLTSVFTKEAKKPIFIMFGTYIAISLVMGLAGGIDNAAHLGGLLAGAITSLLIYYSMLRKKINHG